MSILWFYSHYIGLLYVLTGRPWVQSLKWRKQIGRKSFHIVAFDMRQRKPHCFDMMFQYKRNHTRSIRQFLFKSQCEMKTVRTRTTLLYDDIISHCITVLQCSNLIQSPYISSSTEGTVCRKDSNRNAQHVPRHFEIAMHSSKTLANLSRATSNTWRKFPRQKWRTAAIWTLHATTSFSFKACNGFQNQSLRKVREVVTSAVNL